MIKVRMTINFSKVLALLILIASVYVSIKLKDPSVFTFSVPFAASIVVGRDIWGVEKKGGQNG